MKRVIFHSLHLSWLAVGVALILFALALSLLRLGMPWASDYRDQIASEISRIIKHPVDIRTLKLGWSGHRPMVQIRDINVSEPGTHKPLMGFDHLYIELDPWRSLTQWRPAAHRVVLAGSHIAITRSSDGQIHFKGFESLETTEGASLEQIAGLNLSLRDIEIDWSDEPLHQDFNFIAQSLEFQVGDRSVAIDTHIDLPESLGEQVHLVALAEGPLSSFHDWQLEFFVRGRSIDVTGLPLKWPKAVPQASSGELNLSLWGQWNRNSGIEVSGSTDLYDARFDAPSDENGKIARFAFVDELSAQLQIMGTAENWQLHLDQLSVATPQRHWPESGLSLAYENLQGEGLYRGAIDFIDAGEITKLLSLSPKVSKGQLKKLQSFQADGDLSGLAFKYRTEGDHPEFSLDAHIDNAQWLSENKVPGLMGVSGDVSLDERGGELLLDSHDVFFIYPKLFYWPMEFQELQAQLKWFMEDDALRLSLDELRLSNDDAEIVGGAQLALGEGEEYPSLNLEVLFPRAALKKVRRYIPYHKFKSVQTRKWLQKAFGGGQASNGRFSYQGPLSSKAFKEGKAELLASFDVENAVLHYQKGWPSLRKLKGEIIFKNASLHARIDSGRIFNSSIRPGGQVDIKNFYRSRLDINAAAKATLPDVIRFVGESPLGKGMEDFLAQVDSDGRTNLALKLRIPLSGELRGPLKVDGKLGMKNARLSLPEHNVDFNKISGGLSFTKDQYSAKGIKAVFRDQPVVANIETKKDGQIEVSMTGDFPILDLLPEARPILEHLTSGTSRWLGTVGIPPPSARDEGESIWVNVSSLLEGVQVDLPAPLGKQASRLRDYNLRYHFTPELPGIEMTYGNSLYVLGELEKGAGFTFRRAVIGLSEGGYQIPENGIMIKGHWPSVQIDAWNEVIKRYSGSGGKANPAENLARLNAIDVAFGYLDIGGRKFSDMQIQSAKEDAAWRIHIDSPALAGDVLAPLVWGQGAPLEARLNRLHLYPMDTGKPSTPLSPLLLPGIRLEVDDFQHEKTHFTKLLLNTTPNRSGQTINLLKLDAEDFSIQASGSWLEEDQIQRTVLDTHFTTKNLGRSLVALDYGDNLVAGKGEAKGRLSWLGPAYNPDIAGLNGSFEFKYEDGMLRKVDPGLGRLLSLLSVHYLPRRLKLDFKDVADEGFRYDLFNGTATIENGRVDTPGVLIDGPSAALALSGKTGLVEQDYALHLELVPKYTYSVPLAAGVLAGPQAGLLVYLFNRVAEGAGFDINKTVALKYDITGTWEDPIITPLKKYAKDKSEKYWD